MSSTRKGLWTFQQQPWQLKAKSCDFKDLDGKYSQPRLLHAAKLLIR